MLSHNDVTNLPENFQEYLQYKALSEKQMQIIAEYQQTIHQQQEKLQHLEALLSTVSPEILPSNEEIIAHSQLSLFRQKIADGKTELSLDETRKVEIYTKILHGLGKKEKPKPKDVTPIEDLLLLAEESDGSSSK